MSAAGGRWRTAGAAAVAQPWDALMIAAAAYLLVGAARIHTLVPGAHLIRPGLLFAAIGMLAYLQSSHPERSLQRLRHPIALCMGFVVAWATLGAPFGLYPGNSIRFLLTNFYTTVLLLFLVAAAVRDVMDLRRMLGIYAAGAVVFSIFAALPGGYRSIGTGGYDANDSAMFVVSALPLTAYYAVTARGGLARIVWAAGMVVCTIAVVRSGSRGAFLAFGAVVIYQLLFFRALRPGWRIAGAAALVVCLLFAAAREPEYWERMSTLR
ncbi:MAG TPA: hypothetical protein VNZ57_09665, partial [Longimicrobiales bacterium]|nr:hypothetical protein [Longimicrobiales bacterium]